MRPITLALAASAFAFSGNAALAKDYLVTIAKPNLLYVIDAEAREITKECVLDFNVMPGIFVMSPDNTVAYILGDRWENVHGVNIDSCETMFSARQSYDNVRVKTIGSLALSKDGTEIYTVQNRTRLLPDRHEVLDPRLAVFNTGDGLDAEPARTFPAPRRVTLMQTDREGAVYLAGHDIFAMNPETGEMSTKIANASWDRPTYSPPDVLAFWPVGTQNDEFMLLYSAAVFTDETFSELADFVWGYQSIDLTTGEAEIDDFASFEVIMFSAVRNPNAENELYGVYTQLSKHDLATDELVKRVDLPHTYYCVNISTDGSEIYVGGTMDDIGIYDSETLERIGEIWLPSGGDMAASTLHVIQR